MSMNMTYGYKDIEGDRLTIANYGERLCITTIQSDRSAAAYIETLDAPAVALELLKASVSDWSTQPVELVAIVASFERYVKAHDPKVKLQERRDELAAELSEGRRTYGSTGLTAQAAIDRIIELEDGK